MPFTVLIEMSLSVFAEKHPKFGAFLKSAANPKNVTV